MRISPNGTGFFKLPTATKLAVPPGTIHKYSSNSPSLCAIVAQKVLGGDWEPFYGFDLEPASPLGQYVIERILLPTQQAILPDVANYWEDGPLAPIFQRRGEGKVEHVADGTVYGSNQLFEMPMANYAAFAAGLNQILPAERVKQMLTPEDGAVQSLQLGLGGGLPSSLRNWRWRWARWRWT